MMEHDHAKRTSRTTFIVACWFGLFAFAIAAAWAVWLWRISQ